MSFRLGQYDVLKCWEYAIPAVSSGESITIDCPAFYAHGGSEFYSDFDHEKIRANTDLTFTLDILNCEETLEDLNEKNSADHNKAKKVKAEPESARKEKIEGSGEPLKDDAHYDSQVNVSKKATSKVKEKKILANATKEVKNLKKEVASQEKKLEAAKETEKEISDELRKSDKDFDMDKVMKKQEKIVVEETILEQEKDTIKKAETTIKKAEKAISNETKAKKAGPKAASTDQATAVKEEKLEEAEEAIQKIVSTKEDNQLAKNKTTEEKAKTASVKEESPKEDFDYLGPMEAIYIQAMNAHTAEGEEMYLTLNLTDLYSPRTTGVYSAYLAPFTGKKNQRWSYNPEDKSFKTHQFPNVALFEGSEGNLIAYKYMGLQNQKYSFDLKSHTMFNALTHRAVVQISTDLHIGKSILKI